MPDSGIKEPYWYYQGQNLYPENTQVLEAEINSYIHENLRKCLRNFTSFSDKFEVDEKGTIKATTQLTNNDVVIKVDFPLQIKNKGIASTTEFSEFIVHVPPIMRKTYQLSF